MAPAGSSSEASELGEIKVHVEKPGAWARRLTITVPADRLERERKSAVQKLAKQVRLPGFRKGKVPDRIMQQRFGAAIEQEMLERVMGDAYREALQREGLQPISQGSIDNISYQSGQDLTFNVDLEVRPEVELNVLGGFELRRDAPAVTDEHVDQMLERLRDEHATWSPLSERPVAGDMVSVEITPLDSTNADPKPRPYQLVLGEGQALPAIEDAIRTLEPGGDGEFTVELPKDVDDAAAGSELHRIRIALLDAKRAERPALDDDFARAMGDFEDLAMLRQRIRDDLEAEAARDAELGIRQQIVQRIGEANPFELPDAMVDGYLERVMPERDGIDPNRLAELRASARPAAEHAIRRILIVERVAELEGLRASAADVEARIASIAERLGRGVDDVRGQLHKNGRLREIEDEITESRVFDYLKSLSIVQ
jgi:trigger factor